jgi:hypothetical protein
MRRFPLILAGLLFSVAFLGTALAQTEATPIHVQSAAPLTSRFEIVQSTIAAKLTFRLDKRAGLVWQIVHTSTDDLAWQLVPIISLPQISTASETTHYQLFLSGIANRFVFLLNLDTGKTWQLQSHVDEKTKEESLAFVPLD